MRNHIQNIEHHLYNYFISGRSSEFRFGQWYCNFQLPESELPWPSLYYCEDIVRAIEMVSQFEKDFSDEEE